MNKDNQQNPGQGNHFFSGFLLGVIVGAFCVFFLGTKKGKKLLKAISEEGSDSISNILNGVDKAERETYRKENPSFTKVSPSAKIVADEPEKQREEFGEKPKIRRFFKGVSRRLN